MKLHGYQLYGQVGVHFCRGRRPASAKMSSSLACSLAGFTVIELIASVAVLSILAVLAIGAIRTSMENAKAARCLNNLKHVGSAMLASMADSKQFEVFSGGTDGAPPLWGNILLSEKYLPKRELARCPDAYCNIASDHNLWAWSAYGIVMLDEEKFVQRDYRNSITQNYFMHPGTIASPSKTPLFADSVNPKDAKKPQTFRIMGGKGAVGNFDLRHRERANVVFHDGHAESLARQSLLDLEVPPERISPEE